MTTMRPLFVAVACAAALAIVGAAGALAAEPALGGKVSAGGRTVSVLNQGVPAVITLSASSPLVSLADTTFTLASGETAETTFAGPPEGLISAHFVTVEQATGNAMSDSTSVVVSVGLHPARPYSPAPDYTPIGIGALCLLALAFVALRVKPWRFRLTRV